MKKNKIINQDEIKTIRLDFNEESKIVGAITGKVSNLIWFDHDNTTLAFVLNSTYKELKNIGYSYFEGDNNSSPSLWLETY